MTTVGLMPNASYRQDASNGSGMDRSGFSLIELLITLSIVAVLASVAVPAFSSQFAKKQIERAQSDLEFLTLRLDHRYQRILSYPADDYETTNELQVLLPNWSPTSDPQDFVFSSENASSSSYTLKATGVSGLVKDCVISVTHEGVKNISDCDDLVADGQ